LGSLRSIRDSQKRKERVVLFSPHPAPTNSMLVLEGTLSLMLTCSNESSNKTSLFLCVRRKELRQGPGSPKTKICCRYRFRHTFTRQEALSLMNEWIVRISRDEKPWGSILGFYDSDDWIFID
jgi:hypothetical protein